MQILTEAEAEAEEFWQKKMLKKGHCLGKAHCIYSDNTVYYTVYIYTLQHYVRYEGASSPRVRSGHARAGRRICVIDSEMFYQKRGEMTGVGASGTTIHSRSGSHLVISS